MSNLENFTDSPSSQSSRTIPKDLGSLKSMVVGWENNLRSRSPIRDVWSTQQASSYPSTATGQSLNVNESSLSSATSAGLRSQTLKEQFFLDSSPSPSSAYSSMNFPHTPTHPSMTFPHSQTHTPTTPTYGGSGYRFAGAERLAQRQKIYEPVSPDARKENISLSTKRDLFYRDSPTSSDSTMNSNAPTKDLYYSRNRNNLDSIGLTSGKTGATSVENSKRIGALPNLAKDSDSFVGFSAIPNQIHRKTVKKGFEFTLMVVGESGLGKSTLVNSMFLTDIYSDEYPGPSKRATKTVEVETTKVLLKEKSVNLHLTIVDTPGFGAAVDNSNCWQPIVNYIETRYEEYLNAETRVHRTHTPDTRVHACLYFINPSGHGLKPIDIEFMLHLHDKVNIIPVIAKADTMTPEECQQFKKNVMAEISQNKIKVYEFPDCDDDEDNKQQKKLKNRIPFAVVGSNYIIESDGERKRGRKYPWGLVEIENMEHCDFVALRNLLMRHYMLDLIDTTNNIHYENYRCRKLTAANQASVGNGTESKKSIKADKNPLAQMEEEKKEHEAKMKKMEYDMEQVFEMKVNEKIKKLKDSEEDLQRRHDQMNKQLEQQRQELEEKRKAFEKEKAAFELVSKDMEELRRVNTLEANSKENLDSKNKEKKKKGLF